MTQEELLKARARIAYQPNALTKRAYQQKKAEDDTELQNAVRQQLIENEQELAQAKGDLANVTQDYNNLRYGLGASGAGLAGGAAVGAATYGITGLFPSLRKRRLLRALIALGAGGAGGAGLGYLTYRGLQNGTVQDLAGKAKDKAVQAGNYVADKAKGAYDYVKEKVSPTDPNAEAKAKGQPYAVTAKEQEAAAGK